MELHFGIGASHLPATVLPTLRGKAKECQPSGAPASAMTLASAKTCYGFVLAQRFVLYFFHFCRLAS